MNPNIQDLGSGVFRINDAINVDIIRAQQYDRDHAEQGERAANILLRLDTEIPRRLTTGSARFRNIDAPLAGVDLFTVETMCDQLEAACRGLETFDRQHGK